MAELVDALVLGTSFSRSGGSSPLTRTKKHPFKFSYIVVFKKIYCLRQLLFCAIFINCVPELKSCGRAWIDHIWWNAVMSGGIIAGSRAALRASIPAYFKKLQTSRLCGVHQSARLHPRWSLSIVAFCLASRARRWLRVPQKTRLGWTSLRVCPDRACRGCC